MKTVLGGPPLSFNVPFMHAAANCQTFHAVKSYPYSYSIIMVHSIFTSVAIVFMASCLLLPMSQSCHLSIFLISMVRITTYPEKPKNVILFLSKDRCICIGRDDISKQPETKSPSKNINVFL